MHIQDTRLSNGLHVVTASSPHLHSASFGVFINAGARQETPDNNGVAHFLEHMMFKGTSTRSAYEISRQVEVLGSNINAFTGMDMTAYHSTGLASNIGESVDIIADALTDSLFAASDIALESGVIAQEINRHEDSPGSLMFDALQAVAYPGQSLGRPVLGSADFVAGATEADFRSFTAQHYTADNMIVAAAGGFDHDSFVRRVDQAFNVPALPRSAARAAIEPARYVGGSFVDRSRDFKQVAAGIGFASVSLLDEAFCHHVLLAGAFGGGMSSPLFTEIREKRGLVYSTGCQADMDVDHGRIIISGGMTADNVEAFVSVACREFRKMADNISDTDLLRAKNAQLTGLAMLREKTFSSAVFMARSHWQRGRVRDLAEIRAEIKAASVNDLKAAAKAVLATTPSIVLVGPAPDADYAAMVEAAIA